MSGSSNSGSPLPPGLSPCFPRFHHLEYRLYRCHPAVLAGGVVVVDRDWSTTDTAISCDCRPGLADRRMLAGRRGERMIIVPRPALQLGRMIAGELWIGLLLTRGARSDGRLGGDSRHLSSCMLPQVLSSSAGRKCFAQLPSPHCWIDGRAA